MASIPVSRLRPALWPGWRRSTFGIAAAGCASSCAPPSWWSSGPSRAPCSS